MPRQRRAGSQTIFPAQACDIFFDHWQPATFISYGMGVNIRIALARGVVVEAADNDVSRRLRGYIRLA